MIGMLNLKMKYHKLRKEDIDLKGLLYGLIFLLVPVVATAAFDPQSITADDVNAIPKMTVQTLKAKVDKGERVAIIDSRTGTSWDGSKVKIKGAIRIMLKDLVKGDVSKIPMGSEIVVYCT